MFLFVILGILLLVLFWQYILAALSLWVLLHIMHAIINWTVVDAKPNNRRKSSLVQTWPVAGAVQARPVAKPKPGPARELPAPDYLPKWSASRRLDVGRELAEWQKAFDSAAE